MHSTLRRALAPALVLGLSGVTLTGCGGPDQNDVAGQLAAGLSTGKLGNVPFTGTTATAAQADLGTITAGLGAKATRKVTVKKVSEPTDENGADTATATLHHTWTLPSGAGSTTWSYDTTARLSEAEEGWAVHWEPSLVADLSTGEKLAVRHDQSPRADILGADGKPLVTNRPVVRYGIDKSKVPADQVDAAAKALAGLVGVDPAGYAARVAKAGPKQFVDAITLREPVEPRITSGVVAIPGAFGLKSSAPLGPSKTFARPVLGAVGEATADVLKKHPEYQAGDLVGLSGLQSTYDSRLAGTATLQVTANRSGASPRLLFEQEGKPGSPVTVTLNESIQNTAESLLAGVGPASAIVVVRPSTGEVVAAASGPGGKGYSTATLGRYAPGSTFKVVTSLALLRTGLTPDSPVECPGSVTVDGRSFGNDSDFPADGAGTMTLRQALAKSCNTAFIGTARKQNLTPEQLASAAASLGFAWDPKDSGANVFTGNLGKETTETEKAAALIGQGKVTASPLAMSAIVSSVSKGSTVVPRLVSTPAPPEGAAPAQPLTAQEAEQLRSMMAAVVTEGTGTVLSSASSPDKPVIAKTGTAEYGTGNPPPVHAWMIAAKGDLAATVMVADGQSGARTAGPIMAQLLAGLPG